MQLTPRLLTILGLSLALACGGERPAATDTTASTSTAPVTDTAPAAPETGTAEIGQPMPAYKAKLLSGGEFDVATTRGKVTLLNLWATWCGPCIYEIPELQKLHDEHRAKGFQVVGVSVDESGDAAVRPFAESHDMRYPIGLDPEGQLANIFQTTVLPTSVLIDRDGKVVWKRMGLIPQNDAELAEAIQKAL